MRKQHKTVLKFIRQINGFNFFKISVIKQIKHGFDNLLTYHFGNYNKDKFSNCNLKAFGKRFILVIYEFYVVHRKFVKIGYFGINPKFRRGVSAAA